jgi:hypothetical protein
VTKTLGEKATKLLETVLLVSKDGSDVVLTLFPKIPPKGPGPTKPTRFIIQVGAEQQTTPGA